MHADELTDPAGIDHARAPCQSYVSSVRVASHRRVCLSPVSAVSSEHADLRRGCAVAAQARRQGVTGGAGLLAAVHADGHPVLRVVWVGCILRGARPALHEQPTGGEPGALLRHGAALYRTVAIVAFAVFCLLPQHMRGPFGWLVESIIPTEQRIEVSELLREAVLGDPYAQNALGHAYADGALLPIDPAESARWHLAAAGQDHRGSQVALCKGYFGEGGDLTSVGRASRWCGAAAQQGDPEASFLMASMYSQGRGVERDRDEANRLYRTAAEGGVAEAQVIVGLDYADDENLPVDLVESYRWLTLASNASSSGADLTDVIELRESVRTRLSTEQLAEARRMVLEWQPSLPGGDD